MTIDAATGAIGWTPTNAQVGLNPVIVRAEDGGGLSDTQSFSVVVANVNDAPTITSAAVTTANAESPYSYDVDASDPDTGDTQLYSLDVAPVGMTIDSASGLIQWTPTSSDIGNPNDVTVRVADMAGDFDTQSFSVSVSPAEHRTRSMSTIFDSNLKKRTGIGGPPSRCATMTTIQSPE